MGLWIDIFMHICVSERDGLDVEPFGSMFLERNYFFITLLTFIHFVSDSIWRWHALLMYPIYVIEEIDFSQENIWNIIRYVKKTTYLWKLFLLCVY